MTPQEIQWVNEYHDKVRRELSPLLSPEENAWLTNAQCHCDPTIRTRTHVYPQKHRQNMYA